MNPSLKREIEKIELLNKFLEVKHSFYKASLCTGFLGKKFSPDKFRKPKSKPYPEVTKRNTKEKFYVKITFKQN